MQGVLAQNYELYKDERTKASYAVPSGNDVEGYRKAIEDLPGQESPGIFGLHANADLTFRSLQVQAGVQLILDTQPAGAKVAGGVSKEEVVDQICEDLLTKVWQGSDCRVSYLVTGILPPECITETGAVCIATGKELRADLRCKI